MSDQFQDDTSSGGSTRPEPPPSRGQRIGVIVVGVVVAIIGLGALALILF